jgi:hypothetical protein
MTTQHDAPPRASGPFLMRNNIQIDHGPRGVLGAVGTRRIGTDGTMRGVKTERPAMSDPTTNLDGWKAEARDALRGIAAMHGCVNRQYTADLVNELIEAACKDGRTPDLNVISAELIRQIEANKESAPMTKQAAKPAPAAKQASLPVTRPAPDAGPFGRPVAELDAAKATPAPAQTDAARAADLDALLGPDTLPYDDLAESAVARAALRGNDKADAPEATPVTPAPEPWYRDDENTRKFWLAVDKSATETGYKGDGHALALKTAGGTLDKWNGSGKELLDQIRELMVAQKPAEKPQEAPRNEPSAPVLPETANDAPSAPEVTILGQIKTLTGVGAADIPKRMNGRFPAPAYEPIPYGPMKGKTDLSFDYVRDRFDEVFGPHGLGWKLEPHAVLGAVEHIEVDEPKRDGGTRHVHMVALEMFVFKYRVVMPDGSMEWIESSPLSDCDDNEDRGYAYRGAWTSLLKQTLRSFGGINHILRNEYTHVQAQQGRRAA